jgi:hypothetical protein
MPAFQAKKGESKVCTLPQEIVAIWWTRQRVHPGEKVKVGALVVNVKEGEPATIAILATVGDAPVPLETLEGKLENGRVEVEWTVKLPARPDWPDEVPVVFDVVVASEVKSLPAQRVVLEVEAGLPPFSL